MKQIKIKVLKAKTPEEIARITESEGNRLGGFASPIIYAKSEFISFIYYNDDGKIQAERKPFTKKEFSGEITNPDSPATFKQVQTLKRLGYKNDTSRLTKKQASAELSTLIKEKNASRRM